MAVVVVVVVVLVVVVVIVVVVVVVVVVDRDIKQERPGTICLLNVKKFQCISPSTKKSPFLLVLLML